MKLIPLFLALVSSISGTFAQASECSIPGASKAPNHIHCVYRDGWYQLRGIWIDCRQGHYEYADDSDQGPVKQVGMAGEDFLFQLSSFRAIQISTRRIFNKTRFVDPNDGFYGDRVKCAIEY